MTPSPPPTMTHLLFENPWPLVIGLLGMAIIFWAIARRREIPRLRFAALIALCAATLIWGFAWIVETEREQLMNKTRLVIDMAEQRDIDGLRGMLTPDVTLTGPNGQVWLEADRIDGLLRRALDIDRLSVQRQQIVSLDAERRDEQTAVSMFDLRTEIAGEYSAPMRTRWAIGWRYDPEHGWRVADLRWYEFMGQPPTLGLWQGF